MTVFKTEQQWHAFLDLLVRTAYLRILVMNSSIGSLLERINRKKLQRMTITEKVYSAKEERKDPTVARAEMEQMESVESAVRMSVYTYQKALRLQYVYLFHHSTILDHFRIH